MTEKERVRLPAERKGLTHRFVVGRGDNAIKVYVQTGEYEDGSLGEVFLKADKQGSLVSGLIDTLSVFMSLSLQYGVPLPVLLEKMRSTRFEPDGFVYGGIELGGIGNCTSIIDYLARWLESKYIKGDVDGSRADGHDLGDQSSSAGDVSQSDQSIPGGEV